jgi:hypothetical protein
MSKREKATVVAREGRAKPRRKGASNQVAPQLLMAKPQRQLFDLNTRFV